MRVEGLVVPVVHWNFIEDYSLDGLIAGVCGHCSRLQV